MNVCPLYVIDELHAEATERINNGESPDNLVHFINDDPRQGLSSGITDEEFQKGGYIGRYYRLEYFSDRKIMRWLLL